MYVRVRVWVGYLCVKMRSVGMAGSGVRLMRCGLCAMRRLRGSIDLDGRGGRSLRLCLRLNRRRQHRKRGGNRHGERRGGPRGGAESGVRAAAAECNLRVPSKGTARDADELLVLRIAHQR